MPDSSVLDKTINLGSNAENLRNTLDFIRESGSRYAFLGEYRHLPHAYKGNDIDIVIDNITVAKQALAAYGWVVQQSSMVQFRAFLYLEPHDQWAIADVIHVTAIPAPHIARYVLCNSYLDPNSGLLRPPLSGVMAWHTFKYLGEGAVRGADQLERLASRWRSGSQKDIQAAVDLLKADGLNPRNMELFQHLNAIDRHKSFIAPIDILSKLADKKRQRHRKRLVFGGDIRLKNLKNASGLILSLIKSYWRKPQNQLPTFAIVGNDGSGKTVLISKTINGPLIKTDPVRIVMRRNAPWTRFYGQLRPTLFLLKKKSYHFACLAWLLSWIMEIGDFADRWVRFQIGRLWADAGFGLVFFERYPTDRLRGEYPGPKGSFHPLEQFFPMPDVVVLMDVTPEQSLARKPNDGHTLQEMTEKRQNYLRLIEEIQPHEIIPSTCTLDEVQQKLNRIIWKYATAKQELSKQKFRFPAEWRPRNV
jgi:hypothetical protein